MNKPDLTPRQQQALKLYHRKHNQFIWPLRLSYLLGWISIFFYIYQSKTRFQTPGQSPLGNVMLVGLGVAFVLGLCAIWAHKRAFDAVRRAGLLDEETEIIPRTATIFAGETLAFGYSKNRWSDVGLLLFLVAVAALLGWFGIFFTTQISERILTAPVFAFFFGYAIILVACWNQPTVRLDERGVFSHYLGFWPRLVRWNEIERAEFYRWSNFYDGAEIFKIHLKNAAGQTLLTLNAATFVGAPPDFEARFVAELRRRLTGNHSPQNEELPDG